MAKKKAATKNKALWGGRFKKALHPTLKEYSYSLPVDIQMLEAEIAIDIAWARMLAKGKLIKETESKKMVSALQKIEKELYKKLESDNMAWMDEYEDIHSLIQSELEKKVGVLGKKIHTGRSRNDLVVASSKMILSHHCTWIESQITYLQAALVLTARRYQDCLMAGVTHLRKAQPLLLAHHLLAYVEMLEEDRSRLTDAIRRLDVLPLGSAALAGSGLKIDQAFLAKELGFSKITRNSLQSVSDRAFVTEVVSVLAILWMHLSRLSEDFILWNSEFCGYLELDDSFSTGSSLMPQKKNPDVFELTRGKAGTIFGYLQAQLTMQKGLPLSYNRDLQEDKPQTFQAIAETGLALDVLAKTIITATFNKEALLKSIEEDTLYATDLLDYLVKKGMPFTEAHENIGKIVYYAQMKRKTIRTLTLEEFESFSFLFKKDVYAIFDGWKSVSAKTTQGSTHPEQVEKEITRWEKILEIA